MSVKKPKLPSRRASQENPESESREVSNESSKESLYGKNTEKKRNNKRK